VGALPRQSGEGPDGDEEETMNGKGTRRTAWLAALAATAAVAAACGGSSSSSSSTAAGSSAAGATSAASTEKITLTVGLFGTFGYKEAGLYDAYQKLHPNITIQETSVEQENDYYAALQTHLAAGSGLSDIQGIEVGRIAEVVGTQADKFVDLKSLGADDVSSTFYPWKWQAATTKDGAIVGLGTDTGPLAICYRKDLFAKAGLPTDRATLDQKWSTWQGFIDLGKEYKAKAAKGSFFTDSAGGIYNAVIGQSKEQYYDASGNLIYKTNPAVKNAWDLAVNAAESGISAKLEQFSSDWNKGFSSGSFATVACPAWMIGYIKGQAPGASGKWDVAGIPGGGGNWGGSYLSIPKASKHPQEAYDLIKWLTAPEQQVAMWKAQQHFPSSSTAAEDPSVAQATDTYFGDAPIGTIFNESATKLVVPILGPKDGAIKNAFSQGLVAVEQQGKDPAKAWDQTMSDIDAVVNG
jgi:cellobiose transport system substrate-binding protein